MGYCYQCLPSICEEPKIYTKYAIYTNYTNYINLNSL